MATTAPNTASLKRGMGEMGVCATTELGEWKCEECRMAFTSLEAVVSRTEPECPYCIERSRIATLETSHAELLGAVSNLLVHFRLPDEDSTGSFERVGEVFLHETGYLAPGKSEPMESWHEGKDEERRIAWEEWIAARVSNARQALKNASEVK